MACAIHISPWFRGTQHTLEHATIGEHGQQKGSQDESLLSAYHYNRARKAEW
jgi:hypothetical protein